jgi:hypothetical protein
MKEVPAVFRELTCANKSDKLIDRVNERWPVVEVIYKDDWSNSIELLIQQCKKVNKHRVPHEPVAKPHEPVSKPHEPVSKPLEPVSKPHEPVAKPHETLEPIRMRDRSLWRLVTRIIYPEVDLLRPAQQTQFHKEFNRFIADTSKATQYFSEFPSIKSNFREKDVEEALMLKQPTDIMTEILCNLYNLDIVTCDAGVDRVFRPVQGRFLVVTKNDGGWESDGIILDEYKFAAQKTPKLLDDYQQLTMKAGRSIWKPGKGIRFVLRTRDELAAELEN